MCLFVKINPLLNFKKSNLICWLIFFLLTSWRKLKFKVYNGFNEKIKLFLLETGFSWASFSVLSGMRNVDSCTLPSWCRSICFVLVTINTFLGLLSTMLWRHLTHSKTMAQACSSVIGALKHNCQKPFTLNSSIWHKKIT